MKLPTIRKLKDNGFAHHFLLPVLAVLVVAGIGTYVINASHAATQTSYYTSSCIKTTYGAPNSAFHPCTFYAQELMNGLQHAKAKNLGLPAYGGSTFKYGNIYYLLMNGLYGRYTAQAVTAVTGNANGQLTAGNSGSWQALCRAAASAGMNPGGRLANEQLKFNQGTDTNATQTDSGVFINACGATPVSTSTGRVNGSAPSAPTGSTASSACTAKTFQSGSKDSGSSHCVQYIQQLLNGAKSYDLIAQVSPATINATSVSALGSYADGGEFNVASGFGKTTNNYDGQTVQWVTSFQTYINNGRAAGQLKVAQSVLAPSKLPTNGVTQKATWNALCQDVSHIPAATRAVTNSTDYTGGRPNSAGSNKTNMWYIRSYIRTGVSAASSAGC